MSDIFNEVDEEVRRERLKQIWDRYGIFIVASAIIIIASVGGWRYYQHHQGQKAAEAGAAFDQALTLSEEGKRQEAEAILGKVAATGTSGYQALARLRAAGEIAQRDPKEGVAEYDRLSKDANLDKKFQELAAIRAGFILLDTSPLDEMTRRLEPLTVAKATFRHSARELLALSAWRNGDMTSSRRWSELIMSDAESPANLRSRTERLLSLTSPSAKG